MRGVLVVVVVCAAGCGSSPGKPADASPAPDGLEIDAAPACQPTLLTGGSDVVAQGWSVVAQPPDTLSLGPDYVRLQTSTVSGARMGGQLLLSRAAAVPADQAFTLRITMLVEQVNPHNPSDSAAAILGAFTPQYGVGVERDQMIYLDAGAIGWADGSGTFPINVVDGAYHTYELAVDADHMARVRVDGVMALSRAGFQVNGTIAVGDQTNDANVDSALRIRSITKLCP
jgi:hypothetical protein